MKISNLIKDKNLVKQIFPYGVDQFASISPVNNKLLKLYEYDDENTMKQKVKNSHLNFKDWRDKGLDYRLDKMKNMMQNLEKSKQQLSMMISKEMGKPISESIGEVDKSIKHINYYITNAKSFLHYKEISFENFENTVQYEPLGPLLNITPWNFPIWVPFKSVIPCLVAGNTIIQKPASRVTETSLFIEKLFKESGFEEAFQVTLLPHEMIEQHLFSDFRIRGVIFTGSTRIGSIIGTLSGKYLKKSLLELGGSDPFIILPDADVSKAVSFAAEGRLRNTGQACICAKRIIIHESLYNEFMPRLKEEIKKYKMGDPMDPSTNIGPLARLDLFLNLKRQVISTLQQQSAEIYNISDEKQISLKDIDRDDYSLDQGNFFEPLILTNIKENSPARSEEFFGPVFSIFTFKSEDEAIQLANETEFGLGASIFSKDESRAQAMAKKIESGMVFINSSSMSDSRLPYGGVKNSGYGRTSADNALYEFTNNKVISIRKK